MDESLAKRYSDALFNIGLKKNMVDKFYEQFSDFVESIQKNEKLKDIIESREFDTEQKIEVVKNIFSEKLSDSVLHFIIFTIKKKREWLFPTMLFTFRKKFLEYKNIEEAWLYSTFGLKEDKVRQIKEILEKIRKKNVLIYQKKDPLLIGGLKIKLNNIVYDLSIKGYLERLRYQLIKEDIQ